MSDKTLPIGLTPGVKYFFSSLETRSDLLKEAKRQEAQRFKEIPIDEVEQFFRTIRTQNIFIKTVGLNGKQESTILSKAIFNLNKVVRIFYSISLDDSQSGFVRIMPDVINQTIVIEVLHGLRPKPEVLYHSPNQASIIRFMTRWLLRRIDWKMTKLDNLDLYKQFVEERRLEMEERIQEQIEDGHEQEAYVKARIEDPVK